MQKTLIYLGKGKISYLIFKKFFRSLTIGNYWKIIRPNKSKPVDAAAEK